MPNDIPSIYDAVIKSLHPLLRSKYSENLPLPSSFSNRTYQISLAESFKENRSFTIKDPDWRGNVPVFYKHNQVGTQSGIPFTMYKFERTLILPLKEILGVAEGKKAEIDSIVKIIGSAICGDWAAAALAYHTDSEWIGFSMWEGSGDGTEADPECYVLPSGEFSKIAGFSDKSEYKINGVYPLVPVNGFVRIQIIFEKHIPNPDFDPEMAYEEKLNASFNSAMFDADMSYLAIPASGGIHTSPTILERVELRFKMKPERAIDIATKKSAMTQFAKEIRKSFANRKSNVKIYGDCDVCGKRLQFDADCWCGFTGPDMSNHSPFNYKCILVEAGAVQSPPSPLWDF